MRCSRRRWWYSVGCYFFFEQVQEKVQQEVNEQSNARVIGVQEY
jgi:hypothetical protein